MPNTTILIAAVAVLLVVLVIAYVATAVSRFRARRPAESPPKAPDQERIDPGGPIAAPALKEAPEPAAAEPQAAPVEVPVTEPVFDAAPEVPRKPIVLPEPKPEPKMASISAMGIRPVFKLEGEPDDASEEQSPLRDEVRVAPAVEKTPAPRAQAAKPAIAPALPVDAAPIPAIAPSPREPAPKPAHLAKAAEPARVETPLLRPTPPQAQRIVADQKPAVQAEKARGSLAERIARVVPEVRDDTTPVPGSHPETSPKVEKPADRIAPVEPKPVAKPAEVKPVAAIAAAEAKPVAKPVEAKPVAAITVAEAKPVAKPAEVKPVAAIAAAEAKPVAKPVEPKPVAAKPEPKPVAAKPEPKPAVAPKPETTGPDADTIARRKAVLEKMYARLQAQSGSDKLEESDPRHKDARRLARLFASEIILYNQEAVDQGRKHGGMYRLLKKDIDRCREVFKSRVAPEVAVEFDYLYDELLLQIALGDESKLGPEMPKPVPPRKP